MCVLAFACVQMCVYACVCVRVSTVISFLADLKSPHWYLVTLMTASGIMELSELLVTGNIKAAQPPPPFE